MGGVKRTADGVELSHRLLGILATVFALGGGFIGVTAAGVNASNKISNAATRSELRDSVKALRDIRKADSISHAQTLAEQGWYNRQTWLLVCKNYNNPAAFCAEPNAAVLQAGKSR